MADTEWTHGSPYDRGRADSYYRRKFNPHWYNYENKAMERRVKIEKGTPEYEEYKRGYEDNEEVGEFKDWG